MFETLLTKAESFVKRDTKRKYVLSMTRFEKVTVVIIAISFLILMTAVVFTKSKVSETNAQIEETRREIATINAESQILQQKVDDLTTYERISSIANEYGLTKANAVVRTVNK
ncbi:cell division protein FtsL [Granulicatella sp. zg-ZJ]|uniref:cell division protein FtsL n=1 Tax=unclassified Granulicatella TaxID=2630493 RepID=UPI0013C26648|nr:MULTISPECIES: cell division protein FtsL [unclassified Granulicatella]MBS4750565.1 cell division protein FtsL [Carnobacteriaceae bacterium zg-ZUI78]NEW62946.1 cell division protein FtsL [Granulicatella sp. zg-ZJ]NEW66660.1 cell division protein FtsL [Granulicatella sp. zg-84]QMI85321.1 cell division protein FtsL [Carnobacteriaceae bacterium zg-84]